MKEARIILPVIANAEPAARLKAGLARIYGGYSAYKAEGGWVDGKGELVEEPVVIYDVAMEDSASNSSQLRALAEYIGALAEQQCIYVRYASGEVELVVPEPLVAMAA